MKLWSLLLLALSGLVTVPGARAGAEGRVSIADYGAAGDGRTVDTQAIQRAIDACAAAGGGTLVVPPGVYLSGALYFKPGVNLELQQGAVLKSTTRLADFPPIRTNWEGLEGMWTSAFLNFLGGTEVSLTGAGTVDGSGLEWPGRPRRPGGAGPGRRYTPANRQPPPRAIVFQDCTGVRVQGIRLLNQARWGLVFLYCRDVAVEDVRIRVDRYVPSSDGIDVCSSRDVRIQGCDIACYDDDISIKSGKDEQGRRLNRPSENVVVSNCTFGTGGGVAIGSEVSGSVRHVLVEHCRFVGTDSAARIKSQPSRGGVIEDIVFRNLQLTNVGRAIDFDLAWRMVPPLAPPAPILTRVDGVKLIGLTGTARSAGVIRGYATQPFPCPLFQDNSLVVGCDLVLDQVSHVDHAGLALTFAAQARAHTGQ